MAARTDERVQIAGFSAVAVVVAILGWFFVASPWFSDAQSTRDQVDKVKFDNSVLANHINDLRTKHLQITQTRDELAKARGLLPVVSNVEAFTQQLAADASAAKVTLTSVVAAQPAALTPAVIPAQSTNGNNASPAPLPNPQQAVPGQIYSIRLTVLTTGVGAHQLEFLHSVQLGARAALVTSVAVAPEGTAAVRSLTAPTTMTLQLQIFVQPAASGGTK